MARGGGGSRKARRVRRCRNSSTASRRTQKDFNLQTGRRDGDQSSNAVRHPRTTPSIPPGGGGLAEWGQVFHGALRCPGFRRGVKSPVARQPIRWGVSWEKLGGVAKSSRAGGASVSCAADRSKHLGFSEAYRKQQFMLCEVMLMLPEDLRPGRPPPHSRGAVVAPLGRVTTLSGRGTLVPMRAKPPFWCVRGRHFGVPWW